MLWLIYNVLFAVVFTAMLPHFLLRMRRRGGYARDFGQRLGRYAPDVSARLGEGGRVWIHAVSVGEVYVALRLMREWRSRLPDERFVLSVTTSTAHAIAERQLDGRDVLIYFPADFPLIMRRVLKLIRPSALILVEVEFWPNLIRRAKAMGTPVFLVNGRMSDRSFRGYRRVGLFTRRILGMFDLLGAQSEEDGARLIALGAPAGRVVVTGSAKYDVATADAPDLQRATALLRQAGVREGDRILLGGSTWPGEEALLIDVFKGLKTRYRDLVLVLAPRHVERTNDVMVAIKASTRTVVRRSTLKPGGAPMEARPDIFLLDTTGELRDFYGCADVIFVGKSLTQHGGQNIIEPALFGKPIVVGPNMENFRAIVSDFADAGALMQIRDLQGLRRAVDDMLDDESKRRAMGEAARNVLQQKSGAVARTMDGILSVLSGGPQRTGG